MEAGQGKTTTATPKRLALLVGCNYAGTRYELKGCINDVHAARDLLLSDRFGFAPGDVTVLTDERGAPVLPTGANVKRALSDMVARAAGPGDVLFFHFSGHGTLVSPVKPHHHLDEAIVPCDWNVITDVDFRELVDRVADGASFVMVSDSCHSGGLIDQEKEQIGPHVGRAAGGGSSAARATTTQRARFIPYDALLAHLSAASGIVNDAASSHDVAHHLVALFGADASAKFRHGGAPLPRTLTPRPDAGILLSGCQTDELSSDKGEGGKPCGAFSSALQAVLAAHPASLSNREVVARARAEVQKQGVTKQHPCLYCTDANADAPFLCQKQQELV